MHLSKTIRRQLLGYQPFVRQRYAARSANHCRRSKTKAELAVEAAKVVDELIKEVCAAVTTVGTELSVN